LTLANRHRGGSKPDLMTNYPTSSHDGNGQFSGLFDSMPSFLNPTSSLSNNNNGQNINTNSNNNRQTSDHDMPKWSLILIAVAAVFFAAAIILVIVVVRCVFSVLRVFVFYTMNVIYLEMSKDNNIQ